MLLDFFFLFISPCGLHFWDFFVFCFLFICFFKLIFLYFRNSLKGLYRSYCSLFTVHYSLLMFHIELAHVRHSLSKLSSVLT